MMQQGKAAQAYDEIERLIVFQELAPGSLVSEAVLMERTGLGRTPVREALQQLARNRLVEIHPNKGVLVPPASVEAQLRMLELRRVLEALAVRLACQTASATDRKAMQEMVELLEADRFTLRQYLETVKETHMMIVTASHNEYLADAMAPLQGLSRRFWITHVRDEQAEISQGSALHASILRSVLERDAEKAEKASHALNDYLVEFAYRTVRTRIGGA
ncbi:GntR family transcriptional regulator [Paenarthrobacter sp. TYUT067]|uniref:GntR family transcriptional regulator n=1 Tax=Paenarthrobacter sp. TYUT067 TaxID=2926245 RepID=UPI00202DDC7A|nr:GntR family transcriptional regulator [Paenarthrobacter sp. TYUT067]MCM0616538.1 GntR family transcriptional regulator [Paenarthrobacter sp. TYUT067]